jgi:hypothetical protein
MGKSTKLNWMKKKHKSIVQKLHKKSYIEQMSGMGFIKDWQLGCFWRSYFRDGFSTFFSIVQFLYFKIYFFVVS